MNVPVRLAPQMLAAIGRVLETMPVSYSVRTESAPDSRCTSIVRDILRALVAVRYCSRMA